MFVEVPLCTAHICCKKHEHSAFIIVSKQSDMVLKALGTGGHTTDEFSEKFQMAFDPPHPSFLENHVVIFQISCPKSPV